MNDLSSAQTRTLRRFETLLATRGADLGFVGESDRAAIRSRHVEDSLRALEALRPSDADAYDLGSGAGLPGVVVAVARPELRVRLVESQRKRVAWLEMVVTDLGLTNTEVLHTRAQALTDPVDVCFARAFAPLPRSWQIARPLLRTGGRLVYFAGRAFDRNLVPAGGRILGDGVLETSGPIVIIDR
jgi:16S rRNA (guanine527-N7)-methyltransferase